MRRVTYILASLVLAACSAEAPPPVAVDAAAGVAEETDPAAGIDWFDGTVDEAFAHAAASRKPVYLYWGAVWCPPCHAISETVFKRPEFIERSKLFVPVYLDGDTANAQAYGEKFGVLGYPTMIVFGPDGDELTRIPGGIDIQAYANVLDLTLADAASVSSLVGRVLAGPAKLSANECALLAYYSWGQDTRVLGDADRADAFRRMHGACPEQSLTERSILFLGWLAETARAGRADPDERILDAEGRREAAAALLDILGDHELVKANLFTVLLDGPRIAGALAETGSPGRERLVDALRTAYDRIESDEAVYKRERIYTLAGRIGLERIDDPEAGISAALRGRIRETVAWADETTPGAYQRQPIVNALANVLFDAGMDDVAKPLLLAELERSRQPYYFMPALADIEQRAGNYPAALEWLRRAHETSQGPATRFQWGYYYVSGLIEMTPDDADGIHDATVALIEELNRTAGFYQRPKSQLGRLERTLIDWGAESGRTPSLVRIRDSLQTVCRRGAGSEKSRATCASFLGDI